MNVLFLCLSNYNSITVRDIYTDLLREFIQHGHKVFVISPAERRFGIHTGLIKETNCVILRVKTGNIQKTNIIEKGISTVLITSILIKSIKKYFSDVRFDLILYCTPPITFFGAVRYVKNRDNAMTYLLLKDIFPQNAVDIGILSERGLRGVLYSFFRYKEKKLYAISDRIGCMSPANVDYIISNNPELNPEIVEVCPNSVEIIDKSVDEETKKNIRRKYSIPLDRTVFVYGGNLGKPQGISFLIDCLKKCQKNEDSFFLIVGDGTDYSLISEFVKAEQPKNIKLMKRLPKEDYDTMVGACDVGMIFLDHRFTIPNFPSRLLSYMQAKIPVLACTDPNTDIGKVIEKGGFGWWCESNDSDGFRSVVDSICKSELHGYGERAFETLKNEYDVRNSYKVIIDKMDKPVI